MASLCSSHSLKADHLHQQNDLLSAVHHVISQDTDMFIVSKDREVLPCHKSLLTLFSPLAATLLNQVPNCSAPTIFLPDFSAQFIRKFLLILKSGQAVSGKNIDVDIKWIGKIASVLRIKVEDLGKGEYLQNPLGVTGHPVKIKQEKMERLNVKIKQEAYYKDRDDVDDRDREESEYVEETTEDEEKSENVEETEDAEDDDIENMIQNENEMAKSNESVPSIPTKNNDFHQSTSPHKKSFCKETSLPITPSNKVRQTNSESNKDSDFVRLIPDTPPKTYSMVPAKSHEEQQTSLNGHKSSEVSAFIPNSQVKYPHAVYAFLQAVENGMKLKNDEYMEFYDFKIEEDESETKNKHKEEILKKEDNKNRIDIMSAVRKMLISEEVVETVDKGIENLEDIYEDDVDDDDDDCDDDENLVDVDDDVNDVDKVLNVINNFDNMSEEAVSKNENVVKDSVQKRVKTEPNFDPKTNGTKRKSKSLLSNIHKKTKIKNNSSISESNFKEMKDARKYCEALERMITDVMRSGKNPEDSLYLPSKMAKAMNTLIKCSDEAMDKLDICESGFGEDIKREIYDNKKTMEECNRLVKEFMIYRNIFKNKQSKNQRVDSTKPRNISLGIGESVVEIDDSDIEGD